MTYYNSLTNYIRNNSLEVKIGDVSLGKNFPIRLQSMTNTNTHDIEKSVNQTIDIIKAGADFVRITTPTLQDVKALEEIKIKLRNQNINNPLIADIHYNKKIAYAAAEVVEKIRINPGNFSFSTKSENNEIDIIRENFLPLLDICKKHNTTIRIGTNHGSLSKRIIEKYGDTPKGMVEATMEFLRICKEADFDKIVISLKSSNTVVMVQACRLLVEEMQKEDMNFPLHLGVTEAGDAEDGRIKSAIGIGSLLVDGIGDTIRVSLSEAPEKEIPEAKKIINFSNERINQEKLEEIENNFFNPFESSRRKSFEIKNIGGNNLPVVISKLSKNKEIDFNSTLADYYFIYDINQSQNYDNLSFIIDYKKWKFKENVYPIFNFEEFLLADKKSEKLNFVKINYKNIEHPRFSEINNNPTVVFFSDVITDNFIGETRIIFNKLKLKDSENPLIIYYRNFENNRPDFQIKTSIELSTFLIDKLIDGIYLKNSKLTTKELRNISFSVLQASRLRISKTEYISCPSCGRTQFNLEEAIAKIKAQTSHLKGLKIAIMGCIVNGPGEMADADYGYVGAGAGKITLYKNKEIVKKNIPEENAVEELINILKINNHWIEK